MDDLDSGDLLRPFDNLPDPRAHICRDPLSNILLIAIMAVLCGADDWQNVSRWGKVKAKWLSTFMDLQAGVPSRDNSDACLLLWILMPLNNALSHGLPNWFASRRADCWRSMARPFAAPSTRGQRNGV